MARASLAVMPAGTRSSAVPSITNHRGKATQSAAATGGKTPGAAMTQGSARSAAKAQIAARRAATAVASPAGAAERTPSPAPITSPPKSRKRVTAPPDIWERITSLAGFGSGVPCTSTTPRSPARRCPAAVTRATASGSVDRLGPTSTSTTCAVSSSAAIPSAKPFRASAKAPVSVPSPGAASGHSARRPAAGTCPSSRTAPLS